jgi:hypothetical protein
VPAQLTTMPRLAISLRLCFLSFLLQPQHHQPQNFEATTISCARLAAMAKTKESGSGSGRENK